MENELYGAFDCATLHEDRRQEGEFRGAFQLGRDRIIHTSAFRRMQGKTQVFFSGDYDFYRTRLTHSIEVAQIGRSICGFLRERSGLLGGRRFVDPDLVEAACLAHDIGHPPFGHTGEDVLNRLMRGHGGFEGNAQTLRILTETIWSGGTRGMNPPRALLDAVLKYKTLRGELGEPDKHFLYDGQGSYLEFVNGGEGFPAGLAAGPERDAFRSVECQIMDWADDTAYSLNDLADGVNAGFITVPKLEAWAAEAGLGGGEAGHIEFLIEAIRDDRVEPRLGRHIGNFIAATSLVEEENFLSARSGRYRLRLVVGAEARAEAEVYKRVSVDLVFRAPQLKQIDFKSEFLLTRLFEVFAEAALAGGRAAGLLPDGLKKTLALEEGERGKLRRVCDYLASLTDTRAVRTYKRLFDPDFGSIVDLV